MSLLTSRLTAVRVPGLVLVVVLSVVPALIPAPALGTPGDVDPFEPFETVAARPPQQPPSGVWPLRPRPEVVEGFDPPLDPWGSGHRGVDLLGTAGQPVLAALPGRVTFAGTLAGRGVVVVSHGDTRTTYEPVAADVSVGRSVAAAGRLGRLETFGSHCFPRACLHWGWLRGEVYLDPLDLVGGGPVRLLPLWREDPVNSAAPVAARPLSPTYSSWRPALLPWLKAVGFFGGGTSDGADSTP
jgi:murein DD-endopeptidase MepM/ murein hydrolase activator NlpD